MEITTVQIAAIPRIADAPIHDDDQHVPGLYDVPVRGCIGAAQAAAAALDAFHGQVPVRMPDDFLFMPCNPATREALPEDHALESYAYQTLAGKVVKVGDAIPDYLMPELIYEEATDG